MIKKLLISKTRVFNVLLTTFFSTLLLVTVVIAATTIGANITTDGNLTISGNADIEGYTAIGNGLALDVDETLRVNRAFTVGTAGDAFQIHIGGNITELADATHTTIALLSIDAITVTDGGGSETVENLASLYITGAPTAGTAPTNGPFALFIDDGDVRIDGNILYPIAGSPMRTIILTASGGITPTTNGAAQTKVDGTNHTYYVLDYDADTDESTFWQWTMPDSYDDGIIDITYYWEAGATSNDVIWCFQAKGLSANSAEDIDSALSTGVCETDTVQANANDLASVTETGATSNFTAGEYVTFKVYRDANAPGDTMSGDARLLKVKIEYGVDQESD